MSPDLYSIATAVVLRLFDDLPSPGPPAGSGGGRTVPWSGQAVSARRCSSPGSGSRCPCPRWTGNRPGRGPPRSARAPPPRSGPRALDDEGYAGDPGAHRPLATPTPGTAVFVGHRTPPPTGSWHRAAPPASTLPHRPEAPHPARWPATAGRTMVPMTGVGPRGIRRRSRHRRHRRRGVCPRNGAVAHRASPDEPTSARARHDHPRAGCAVLHDGAARRRSGARATSTSERTGPVNARQHVAQLRQCVAPGEPPPPPAAPPSDDNSSNFPPPLWRASSATTTRPPAASSRTPAERGATRLEITHEHQQVGSLGQPTKVADYDGQMTTPSRTTSGSTWRDS